MYKIPQSDKKLAVDGESMTRGNVYSTFGIMMDADKGRIKLNPPITSAMSTGDDATFLIPSSILVSNSTTHTLDTYILSNGSVNGWVWSLTDKAKITTTNAPTKAVTGSSSMCMYNTFLCVSDTDGLHFIETQSDLPAGNWSIDTTAALKNNYIAFQFNTGRLYLFSTYAIISGTLSGTWTFATSGAYTQPTNTFFGGLTCACQTAKSIWYATDLYPYTREKKCYIYEWDGISVNPLNRYTIPVRKIQAISHINDVPVAIDDRGRLWFFNGYTFELKDGARVPYREDDTSTLTCTIHRNGMVNYKSKIYVLVGANSNGKNSTERALSGIWCYDPAIGFYHYVSPDNVSLIATPYALALGTSENTFIVGVSTGITSTTNVDRVCQTDETAGLAGSVRLGALTTQFLESQNLTDIFSQIGIKYRKMIDTGATIEVKYRTWKNIECNATITWTDTDTFTATTTILDGSPTYCTPVAVGDEVMVQNGANAGLIAHITSRTDLAGTTTIVIDRDGTLSSGTANAMFSNYTLLYAVTNDGQTFHAETIGKPETMLQVKAVMSWKGYYDELQEIQVSNKQNEITL